MLKAMRREGKGRKKVVFIVHSISSFHVLSEYE
jgi:hypothetical protein